MHSPTRLQKLYTVPNSTVSTLTLFIHSHIIHSFLLIHTLLLQCHMSSCVRNHIIASDNLFILRITSNKASENTNRSLSLKISQAIKCRIKRLEKSHCSQKLQPSLKAE